MVKMSLSTFNIRYSFNGQNLFCILILDDREQYSKLSILRIWCHHPGKCFWLGWKIFWAYLKVVSEIYYAVRSRADSCRCNSSFWNLLTRVTKAIKQLNLGEVLVVAYILRYMCSLCLGWTSSWKKLSYDSRFRQH